MKMKSFGERVSSSMPALAQGNKPRVRHGTSESTQLAAAMALLLAGCTIENNPQTAEGIEQSESPLTIAQMNPPEPPLVLPLANGVRTKIAQRGQDLPSHSGADTQYALDIATTGTAYTPLPGLIHRVSGNCDVNDNTCPIHCATGWGNHVLLDAVDGHTYIFAHCSTFDAAAPDNRFVGKGTPVCQIGCTGNADGVHLHFDRVRRNGNSYISEQDSGMLTTESGSAEPSIQTWQNIETCCQPVGNNQCDAVPADADCRTYVSFDRSPLDALSTFARSLLANDPRVMAVNGGFQLDQNTRRNDYTFYTQAATVNINGQAVQSSLGFKIGGFAGQNRNPFITTSTSNYWNPATRAWSELNKHTQIHTERFANFDLWDYARAYLAGADRAALGFTQNVNVDNADPTWKKYLTTFNVNGRRLNVELWSQKTQPGWRYARLSENNVTTPFTQL